MTYIEASLSKALKANNFLSGNNPSEGWGSQYLGNPRSLSRFLPEKFIKKLPPQAEISLERGNSENSTTSSDASGSLLLGDSSNQKRTHISSQDKFCNKRVKFKETLDTTGATFAPTPSHPTLKLAALEALQNSGTIEVFF